jgi:hypothetical protein
MSSRSAGGPPESPGEAEPVSVWAPFDELRELNAHGGRLAAAVGIVVALLGALDFRGLVGRLFAEVSSVSGASLPSLVLLVAAAAGTAFVAVAAVFALLVLRRPVPESATALEVLVGSKRAWSRIAERALTVAVWLLASVAASPDPAQAGWLAPAVFAACATAAWLVWHWTLRGIRRPL